ncbi:hypothetical protein [Mycobacterium shigaense]|uniref:hypothetical protein n=1 Tax=Mycobacterium shigaense TaxID=722731 RepID=UPI001E416365|nr:hypothetical protein [Mycobacterium shigaense]
MGCDGARVFTAALTGIAQGLVASTATDLLYLAAALAAIDAAEDMFLIGAGVFDADVDGRRALAVGGLTAPATSLDACQIPRHIAPQPGPSRSSPAFTDSGTCTAESSTSARPKACAAG